MPLLNSKQDRIRQLEQGKRKEIDADDIDDDVERDNSIACHQISSDEDGGTDEDQGPAPKRLNLDDSQQFLTM